MRKLLLSLFAISFLFLGRVAHAENSAASYDNKYYSQQVFVQAYNNTASTMANNTVVVMDTTPSVNPNVNLGQYVTTNGSTTDSVFVFGVTDEAIAAATLGRICVRGPHKVTAPSSSGVTAGNVIGACASSSNACPVTTATGTDRGFLGYYINTTASTDTGDAANTYWAFIRVGVAN